jgi:hypothetical protein
LNKSPSGKAGAVHFDTYDEALIDAYDGYDIDPQIAATLRTQTEESPCLN